MQFAINVSGKRLAILGASLGLALLLLVFTSSYWTAAIAGSLVCRDERAPADALVVDNVDSNYLVFEVAAKLQREGIAGRAIVPVQSNRQADRPGRVAEGFVNVMSGVARLKQIEMVPVHEFEPISLNVATQVRTYLVDQQIRSVVVVAEAFRSRRTAFIYREVLKEAGIQVHCVPVFGLKTTSNWTETWHGIQRVVEQWGKLLYYRVWVL